MDRFNICEFTRNWASEKNLLCWSEEKTSSTNLIAKDPQHFGKDFKIFVTNHQSAGRGRGSHQWQDHNGGQLLSTWSFFSTKAPQPILSIQIGLALYQSALKTWPGLGFSLKAPNDLYLNSEKLAGLLIEVISQNGYQILIGLGLNLFSSPQTLDKKTTSLADQIPVTKADFKNFLNLFYEKTRVLISNSQTTLTNLEQDQILQALNDYPLLIEKYLSIDSFGNLMNSSKKIHWSEL